MGLASWIVAGMIVAALGRLVRTGRRGVALEAIVALVIAFIAGLAATALDFGGWSELDWRAITFAALCTAASIALVRIARLHSA